MRVPFWIWLCSWILNKKLERYSNMRMLFHNLTSQSQCMLSNHTVFKIGLNRRIYLFNATSFHLSVTPWSSFYRHNIRICLCSPSCFNWQRYQNSFSKHLKTAKFLTFLNIFEADLGLYGGSYCLTYGRVRFRSLSYTVLCTVQRTAKNWAVTKTFY
jgi:hypothetical protein